MILANQMVETTWVKFTRRYWESKGYEFTGYLTKFCVKVEELSPKSNVRILVSCDLCGKVYSITYNNYSKSQNNSNIKGSYCHNCGTDHFIKYSKEEVEESFIERGYTPLFENYEKVRDNLEYICNRHPEYIQKIRYSSLLVGHGCYYCGRDITTIKISGANNISWKGGISAENTKIRTSKDMDKWRLDVFHRDKFTCIRCGAKGGKLNAHHILGFASSPELRFNINNGATLCFDCHSSAKYNSFHAIYGKIGFSIEDFTVFLSTTKELQCG